MAEVWFFNLICFSNPHFFLDGFKAMFIYHTKNTIGYNFESLSKLGASNVLSAIVGCGLISFIIIG